MIVEYLDTINTKAGYGKGLLKKLSKDLTYLHGKAFSLSNLKRMRQFFLSYPISEKPSHQLNWSNHITIKRTT